MKAGLIVAGSVILGLLLLLILLRIILRQVRSSLKTYIREHFDKTEILKSTVSANYFGRQSLGGRQVKGNGALVLTKDTLYFKRAVPHLEIIIPLTSILEISMPRSFNGRSVGGKLLCVEYKKEQEQDAIAWSLPGTGEWVFELKKRCTHLSS